MIFLNDIIHIPNVIHEVISNVIDIVSIMTHFIFIKIFLELCFSSFEGTYLICFPLL